MSRGYIRGDAEASSYLGIDRGTLRDWQADNTLANRSLILPRIVRGRKYYCIKNLDSFMNPDKNVSTETTVFHGSPHA